MDVKEVTIAIIIFIITLVLIWSLDFVLIWWGWKGFRLWM